MALLDAPFEHLLRRAGFGATPDELAVYRQLSFTGAVDALVDFERIDDDVDLNMFQPGYLGVATRGGPLAANSNINDARQRWLFRMMHTRRPLQEKMALFWHNHFATGYSKVAAALGGGDQGTRYMAAKPSEDPGGVRGQIEMLREHALGNFRTLLINIAKDPAMLVWLDGITNTRTRPQENFGREIMELFTMGVGHYTEADVYAAARVFTGWNLTGRTANAAARRDFVYLPNQHDTSEKTFTFPIYSDGGKTIPARPAADGMQDGIDFITALAGSPYTAKYLATKLYRFFVSEIGDPNETFVNRIANVYLNSRFEMKAVVRAVLLSPEFWDTNAYFARYSWPVEFVVRAMKDIGWRGFSANDALVPLSNMGQILFEPPDVNGWDLGKSWFSTGSMLARMNFASTLTANQQFNLGAAVAPYGETPEGLLAYVLESVRTAPLDSRVRAELLDYLRANGAWTAAPARLRAKASGLVHLVAATPEYQFI
jgi:uncharacterized protein (DUF1800 family)